MFHSYLSKRVMLLTPFGNPLKVGVGRRSRQDTALALLLGYSSLEEDVAVHAPGDSPGVLHLVVVHTIQGAVADSQHTVIQIGSAGSSEHTRLVQLESRLVSLDGDRHGLLSEGGHQRSIRVCGHISVRHRRNLVTQGINDTCCRGL